MMVSTSLRVSRALDVSMRNSDSGVVMRMSGGLLSSERRSEAGGVAGPDAHGDQRGGQVQPLGRLRDADQRGAEVAFDVDAERLER